MVTAILVVTTLFLALYIMRHRLGLSDSLDFGAGAYYYADIPAFEKYVADDAYHARLPRWVFIVLFLAWGWLMYRLWKWLDSRPDKKGPDRDAEQKDETTSAPYGKELTDKEPPDEMASGENSIISDKSTEQ